MQPRGFLLALAGAAALLCSCTSAPSPRAVPPSVTATPSHRATGSAVRADAAKIGFPRHCRIQPRVDGLPNDLDSGESPTVVRAVHSHCFAVLGSRLDDAVLGNGRRVVIGVHWPTADAKGQRLFFFDHERLIGEDTTAAYLPMVVTVKATGPRSFTAYYAGVGSYQGAAVGGGGMLDVRFTWPSDGHPEPIDRMPSSTYPRCPRPTMKGNKSTTAHKRGRATCWY